MRFNKETPFLFAALCLAADPSFAQQAPTAGQLLQQATPSPRLPSGNVPPPTVEEHATTTTSEGVRFQLRGIRLSGNQAFTEQQLLALVQDGIGKTVGQDELNALARRITDYYRSHGYLVARAYATLQYDEKWLSDREGATSTDSDKRVHELSAGVSGNFTDGLVGGAGNNASLTYSTGRLDLDAASALIDDASAHSAGGFGKFEGSFQRLQRLPANLTLFFNANGQWSDKNLDSSEKMYLGGADGVRAYPQGEASGDCGYLLNVELRHPLGHGWEVLGFYDRGQVRVNHSPWDSTSENERTLAGFGVGANYAVSAFALRVYAAWRAGTGRPTSDSDRSPRIWAQATYQF